jgi:hypothetical protein
MIEYLDHPERGYIELTIDGKLDRKSFDEIVSKLGPRMEQTGKLGILKNVVSFRGVEPSVLWDDFKFALGHLKHVGPVAVVSDKKWIEVWTKLSAPFVKSKVRFFEQDDLEDAREWIEDEMATAKA